MQITKLRMKVSFFAVFLREIMGTHAFNALNLYIYYYY